MLFSNMIQLQPFGLPLNWNADYADGSNYSEYNKDGIRNDFYLIKQNQVIRFGLFGSGTKMFFEMADGSFNINKKRIEVEYHKSNGEILHLTTNFEKKDLITYKEAYTDYSNKQGVQTSNVSSINFGYKTVYRNGDLKIFFQPIVSAPMNDSMFLEVKMTSSEDLDGYLVFKTRGVEIERFHAPLEKNKAGQINWTIK